VLFPDPGSPATTISIPEVCHDAGFERDCRCHNA
jgi:hypothetical protein